MKRLFQLDLEVCLYQHGRTMRSQSQSQTSLAPLLLILLDSRSSWKLTRRRYLVMTRTYLRRSTWRITGIAYILWWLSQILPPGLRPRTLNVLQARKLRLQMIISNMLSCNAVLKNNARNWLRSPHGRRKGDSPSFLSASLSWELKRALLDLLKELNDVFAWTYAKTFGLDPHLVTHKLNIKERIRPVKQALRNFWLEL